jgi:glycosyltransferase involved in cell wall biosynthesis
MRKSRKPLLLVISQVYVPDPASVGQHIADAAEAMAARGYDVRVLTSSRGYEDSREKFARRECRSGVDVIRLPFSSFGKRSLAHRVLGQSIFLIQVVLRGLFARRLAGILVSTSPPMASFAAVAIGLVRRVPITYWLMDMNPDQALAMAKVSARNPLVWAMRWLNRRIFARAANVVVLDRFMAERVQRQYQVRGRMEVLPPWPHFDAASLAVGQDKETRRQGDKESELSGCVSLSPPFPVSPSDSNSKRPDDDSRSSFNTLPLPPGEGRGEGESAAIAAPSPYPLPKGEGFKTASTNPFITAHNLSGRFVVLYSGNHSLASPVTTLVETALRMKDDARFVFAFVGGGMGKRAVEAAMELHRPPNMLSLPYQPLERLHFSLSAADLHIVTLGNEMVGIIHPCKIYGAMAVGRPVLLVGPRPSHAADIIERLGIGWRIDHGDVDGAAALIQQIAAMPPAELAAMGERAREAVQRDYHKELLCAQFCDVIERGMAVKSPAALLPNTPQSDSMGQATAWKAQF